MRAEGRLPVLERRVRGLFEPGVEGAELPHGPRELSVLDQRSRSNALPEPRGNASASQGAMVPAAPAAAMVPVVSRRRDVSRIEPAISAFELLTHNAPDDHGSSHRDLSTAAEEGVAATRAPVVLTVTASPHSITFSRGAAVSGPSPVGHSPRESAPLAAPRQPRSRVHEAAQGQNGVLHAYHAQRSQPAVLFAKAQMRSIARHEIDAGVVQPAPVQISIGRVEIRAASNAVERPRTAGPAAPRLSLDEYLRRRNGGAG
jgi:hypothetical protein